MVKEGILLHRLIDSFTDQHPIVGKSKDRIRNEFHKYTPVIIDVFYDHFLAFHWGKYANEPLKEYVIRIYQLLDENRASFPAKAQYMLDFMIAHNWLENYKTIEGMKHALGGLAKRTRFRSNMEVAHRSLENEYKGFNTDFDAFFPDLLDYVESLGYNVRESHKS